MKPIEHQLWLLGDIPNDSIEQLQSDGWSLQHRWESGAEFRQLNSKLVSEPELEIDCVKVFKAFCEGNGVGEGSLDKTYLSVREFNLHAHNFHILDGGLNHDC